MPQPSPFRMNPFLRIEIIPSGEGRADVYSRNCSLNHYCLIHSEENPAWKEARIETSKYVHVSTEQSPRNPKYRRQQMTHGMCDYRSSTT
jgi:hypothetical protein